VITSIVFVASVPVRVACARRRRQFALSHTAQTCVRFSAAVVAHSVAQPKISALMRVCDSRRFLDCRL